LQPILVKLLTMTFRQPLLPYLERLFVRRQISSYEFTQRKNRFTATSNTIYCRSYARYYAYLAVHHVLKFRGATPL